VCDCRLWESCARRRRRRRRRRRYHHHRHRRRRRRRRKSSGWWGHRGQGCQHQHTDRVYASAASDVTKGRRGSGPCRETEQPVPPAPAVPSRRSDEPEALDTGAGVGSPAAEPSSFALHSSPSPPPSNPGSLAARAARWSSWALVGRAGREGGTYFPSTSPPPTDKKECALSLVENRSIAIEAAGFSLAYRLSPARPNLPPLFTPATRLLRRFRALGSLRLRLREIVATLAHG
jgi:hypothetical protein